MNNHTQNSKIVLVGGTGFLGRTLADHFRKQNPKREIVILSRSKPKRDLGTWVVWDGKTRGPWAKELEGAEAVINLAGRSVNCRYHRRNRAEMMDSRVDSTEVIGRAIAACQRPPKVWLQSSTATIYRHRFDAPNDEETGIIGSHADAKDAFSIEVATGWEDAFHRTPTPETRRLIMRTAMVFGPEPGGVYHVLRRLVRFGLGGAMAGGHQYVSWLHADDWCGIIDWLIEHEEAEGIYNLCAPNPLPNSDMMKILREECGAPLGFGLPQPLWMLELGAFFIRTETELIIKSRRVIPGRLRDEGYCFHHPDFQPMVNALELS